MHTLTVSLMNIIVVIAQFGVAIFGR